MICRSGCVGVVLNNAQIGLVGVMVQSVEHVRRFAHCRWSDPRVERSVMACASSFVRTRIFIPTALKVDSRMATNLRSFQ